MLDPVSGLLARDTFLRHSQLLQWGPTHVAVGAMLLHLTASETHFRGKQLAALRFDTWIMQTEDSQGVLKNWRKPLDAFVVDSRGMCPNLINLLIVSERIVLLFKTQLRDKFCVVVLRNRSNMWWEEQSQVCSRVWVRRRALPFLVSRDQHRTQPVVGEWEGSLWRSNVDAFRRVNGILHINGPKMSDKSLFIPTQLHVRSEGEMSGGEDQLRIMRQVQLTKTTSFSRSARGEDLHSNPLLMVAVAAI